MQHLNDARSAKCREIPVVADVGARDGHIVGVAFYQDFELTIVGQDLGDLRERGFRPIVYLVRAGTVEHVVGERHIDYALEHLHVDLLQFVASERTREVVGEHKIERVALGLGFHELFDIPVGGIDLVDELGDIDATLIVLNEALVERTLERSVLTLEFGVQTLGIGETLFEALGTRARGGEIHLRLVVETLQVGIVGLQFGKYLLAHATAERQEQTGHGDREKHLFHDSEF